MSLDESMPTLSSLEQDDWERKYMMLEAFHRKHGHCNVPANDRFGMHEWILEQRECYRIKFAITPEQIYRLDKLDFKWSNLQDTAKTSMEESYRAWMKMYDQLKLFRKEHGHCEISSKACEKNGNLTALFDWTKLQRQTREKLPQGQIDLLVELDFVWVSLCGQST